MMQPISQAKLLFLLFLLLLFLLPLSLFTGPADLPLLQILHEIGQETSGQYGQILLQLRLPRSLIALIAGATLGLCGAAMQSLLRNPLASPGLIGSASGAALGAVVCLYFGLSAYFAYALPMGGIIGSLAATLLVYMLAGRNAGNLTLILAGVAVNAFTLALISLLLNLAPSPYAVQEITLWMLGSLNHVSLPELWILLPGSLLGWLILSFQGRSLDLLTLGEETAQTMGADLPRMRAYIFTATALAIGSVVAIVGMIGFVGLVVPHLLRPLTGYRPSRLLAASALGGGALLLASDILVRLLPGAVEIKIGVVTSLIGAPFFLQLILQQRRRGL